MVMDVPAMHAGTTRFSVPRWVWLIAIIAVFIGLAWSVGRGVTAWQRHRLVSADYAPAPAGMVFVPPGEFLMGSDAPDADHNERPLRRVFLPGFYIDRHEVTNAEFRRFDSSHTFPECREDWPVVKISKERAVAYAAAAGKRLPSTAEWEKAARGTDGRAYPWGDASDAEKANMGGRESLMPVGSYPQGASPYGALDMAGNAWEWVDDVYRDKESLGVGDTDRGIIRGGAYSYSPHQGRTFYIGFESENLTCGDLGFRCVMDAQPQ